MKLISTALVNAQKQFAPALKTATNPHFRTKYADLAACIEAVVDALNANGIALIQKSHPSDNGIAIETIFVHESGETMSGGVLNLPASKQDPQGYGSAMTYARRYSLMAACGIAPEDDDGHAASRTAPKPVPRSTKGKEELEAALDTANTPEMLAVLWKALKPEERDLVRDFATKKGEQLKGKT
jgi:hypothetical protein